MPFFKKLRRFSRHKKLCEEWALANSRECVEGSGSAGTTHEESEDASEARFTLKYLGSTLVETPSSEEATAEAIKTVITMAKASGKKLQRVSLAVSLKGIRMTDLATEEDQLQVSIYRRGGEEEEAGGREIRGESRRAEQARRAPEHPERFSEEPADRPVERNEARGKLMGMLRGGDGAGRREEGAEEEQPQQYSHDDSEARRRRGLAPRRAEANDSFQNAERLGRVAVGRPDVLVAGVAFGRQLPGRAADHRPLEAPVQQWPTEETESIGLIVAAELLRRPCTGISSTNDRPIGVLQRRAFSGMNWTSDREIGQRRGLEISRTVVDRFRVKQLCEMK
ncbi:uncharacterized protein LOC116432090 isoform X2 [Nomia melanderi]|uniref:uncharacterized protein LOC116432090 isoform X2 n=1 Tax=Nomia melanderi TaxID=2448451 RepID=UPI003FCCD13A